jgi:hypothetical protein
VPATPTTATPCSTSTKLTEGTDVAGGTEKFDAAGFDQEATGELPGAANDAEPDGGGGALGNIGELDDGGELSAAGEPGSDWLEPDAEPGRTPLPQPTSAATTARTPTVRADELAPRRAATARTPTVGRLPPSSPIVVTGGRSGERVGCHYFAR